MQLKAQEIWGRSSSSPETGGENHFCNKVIGIQGGKKNFETSIKKILLLLLLQLQVSSKNQNKKFEGGVKSRKKGLLVNLAKKLAASFGSALSSYCCDYRFIFKPCYPQGLYLFESFYKILNNLLEIHSFEDKAVITTAGAHHRSKTSN